MLEITATIRMAHENAREKGFWESENVGEHFALVHTEAEEFENAFFDSGNPIEEVADIVIRVFDLCGYLAVTLPQNVLSPTPVQMSMEPEDFAIQIHRFTARATQAHRKSRADEVIENLDAIVRYCALYSEGFFGSGALENMIRQKMTSNAARPRKHGALY